MEGGKSRDDREEEKEDIEPYDDDVSAELNEKPELEIMDARELEREMEEGTIEGEARMDEEVQGGGMVGNWSSKGAIQADE